MPAGWKIELEVPRRASDGFVTALEPLAPAISIFETAPHDAGNAGKMRLTAYGTEPPDERLLADAIGAAAAEAGIEKPLLHVTWLPDIDWLARNREGFTPVAVGRYFIHDSIYTGRVPSGALRLIISAATAFGTGAHASTQGCLAALDRLARRSNPGAVLDMGCGTGILALAAALTFRCPTLAVDVDPEAVRLTRLNARANGCLPWVRVARGDGYRAAAVGRTAPYGLVLANILAQPLAAMARRMAMHLRPGGRTVLSGFLAHQERQVLAPHLAMGLRLERRYAIEDWVTLVMSRPEPNRPGARDRHGLATDARHA
ncbi:MAG: 50S ribosomal protein L11 methyltransferase [Alphaproteobacteria bacterium]